MNTTIQLHTQPIHKVNTTQRIISNHVKTAFRVKHFTIKVVIQLQPLQLFKIKKR